MLSEVVDVREAARRLGVSKSHLDKMRMQRSGPRYSKLGHRVVYRLSDLERWLDNTRVETTADYARRSA